MLQKELVSIWPGWTIDRLLGEGSFGKVYRIERENFGYVYEAALKVISIPQSQAEVRSALNEGMDKQGLSAYFRSIVEDIVSEFALMSQMKGNTNIVSYEDHAVIPDKNGIGWKILIRMELLTPLFDYMRENKLKVRDVVALGIDMCTALEVCQTYNIIHRDIKPENIFVSDLGRYKLGDFGIARKMEKTASGLSKKGTYAYMAPEIYKGERYNSSVDIYSLGIVLYRFLNMNRTPFLPPYPQLIRSSDREKATMRRIAGEAIPAPCNANEELSQIVLKACAFDPSERYGSPLEMRNALIGALHVDGQMDAIYAGDNYSLDGSLGTIKSTDSTSDEDSSIDNYIEEKTSFLYFDREEEARRELEEKKKAEEARKRAEKARLEEEARRKAEEERRREEEARRKAEEEKRRQEEARKRAEEEARRKAEEEKKRAEEEKRRIEEERRRKAEEARIKAEEERRRLEEETLRQLEAKRKAEEERRRLEEEERLKLEARKRAEEEWRRAEQARLEKEAKEKAEEQRRQAEEERKRAEEEALRIQEARKKVEEERRRAEEETRRILEARKKAEEERKRAEEEARLEMIARQKAEEEKRRMEEEARLELEAKKKAEEEKQRAEEIRRQREEIEEKKKAEQERRRKEKEEKEKQKEEARLKREEERKQKQEEAQKKKEEEAARRKEEEAARKEKREAQRLEKEEAARKKKEEALKKKQEKEAAAGGDAGKKKRLLIAGLALVLLLAGGGYFGYTSYQKSLEREVPAIANMTIEEATATAAGEDKESLKVEVVGEEYNNDVEKGKIISQDIEAGTVLKKGDTIKVVISKGGLATVPSLVGKKNSEAEEMVKSAGLVYAVSESVYSDDVKKNVIISQDTAENSTVEKGVTVSVVVSKGIEQVKVPDVKGKTLNEAKASIEKAKLKYDEDKNEEIYSDSVESGKIIDQSIKAGKEVDKNKKMHVIVSKGPEPEPEPVVSSSGGSRKRSSGSRKRSSGSKKKKSSGGKKWKWVN